MNFFEQRFGTPGATLRLAALLIVITLSIVASKLAEDHFVKDLRSDCSSLFTDRLMPATTLFHLSDAVYRKRDDLLQHLRHPTDAATMNIDYRLGQHDANIEHHIIAIEKTYLVEAETRWLRKLRDSLTNYGKLERDLLAKQQGGARFEGSPALETAFDELRTELASLTAVQEAVGQQLKSESLSSAGQLTTLLYFQLGIAFALGSLASALAVSLRPPTERTPPSGGKLH